MNPKMIVLLLAASTCLAAPLSAQRLKPGPPSGGHDRPTDPRINLPEKNAFGVRYEPALGRRESGGWLSTQSPSFVNIPQMAASFVVAEDDTNVSITFSAEAYTSNSSKRLFVRALIDGKPAEPGDVVFTEGSFKGARSFIFTGNVDRGIHTVEMQWLVDSDEQKATTAYLRAGSVLVHTGRRVDDAGSLWHFTPPSGPNDETTVSGWTNVPGGGGKFYVPSNAQVMIGFSAETYVQGGDDKRLFVRALVDGVPANPSDVVFARSSFRQSRMMVFGISGLTKGLHTLQMQWLIDAGGTAGMGDRTVSVSAYPSTSGLIHRVVAAPSGPSVQTNSNNWVPVPDLGALVPLPTNGEFAVAVSGEVHATPGDEVWLRLNVGGQVVGDEEVVIANNDAPTSVQSFVFDRKHFFGADLGGVTVEWKVSSGGTATFGDRTMAILAERGSIPDVAEAPAIGLGNVKVEPAIGTRKLLTILWDAHRPAPDDKTPPVGDVADALFGAHSVRDYYEKNSKGLFSIQNEGILGWYDADNGWDYYWSSHPGCGGSIYISGHNEKWAEAILKASATVDFASYDTNRDGVIQPSELGILIIIVQNSDFGTAIKSYSPHCDGTPFVVDGVQIDQFVEWYTSDPQRYFSSAAHELMHLYADLGDLYMNNYDNDIEVGKLSLMGDNRDTSAHLDPMNKLALGWITPVMADSTNFYALEDVKLGGDVLVLPRRNGGNGTEYYLLENRQSSANHANYDEDIFAAGVAVWHIIEDPNQSDFAPPCIPQVEWDSSVSGNGRRGIRVVRPTIDFSNTWAAWNDTRYDLFDFGVICPSPGDNPLNRRNILLWADGAPSGYSIVNWPAAGPLMVLEIGVN